MIIPRQALCNLMTMKKKKFKDQRKETIRVLKLPFWLVPINFVAEIQ